MSLSEEELVILHAAGTAADATLRRQAVAIALAKSGGDRDSARDALVSGYLKATKPTFHLIPRGDAMASEGAFSAAYDALAEATVGFTDTRPETLTGILLAYPAVLGPLRMIIGFTFNELAVAASLVDPQVRVTGNALKAFERKPLANPLSQRQARSLLANATVVARTVCAVMNRTVLAVPEAAALAFHSKLDKRDTRYGWSGVEADSAGVPYSALLYQRYVGGVWRQVQDAYSEVKGDELAELPVEALFKSAGISYWRTPSGASGAGLTATKYGLHPGPDFVIPEVSPTVVLESKIGEDGGTVRDKAARVQAMAAAASTRGLIPCAVVDGKGWSERPSALLDVIIATQGRTYTLSTLPMLLSVPEIGALRP